MGHLKIGRNFLHTHPQTEKDMGVDHNHVVVDKHDHAVMVKFFELNPILVNYIHSPTALKLTIKL